MLGVFSVSVGAQFHIEQSARSVNINKTGGILCIDSQSHTQSALFIEYDIVIE